ncbi:MAG: hypothetical protein WBK88_07100 [Methanothrix sp.]
MAEKFDAIRKAAFLEKLSTGMGRSAACASIGITRTTFRNHYDRYESFRIAVNETEVKLNDDVEAALFNAAIGGNVVACQVWLYNRAPDRWADKRNIQIKKPPGDDNLMVALTAAAAEAWGNNGGKS